VADIVAAHRRGVGDAPAERIAVGAALVSW